MQNYPVGKEFLQGRSIIKIFQDVVKNLFLLKLTRNK